MPEPIAFDSATARLALPLLHAGQAHKEAFHNEALARIDALLHSAVAGEASHPPIAPEDGECWLVASGAQDEWTGHDGLLATRQAGQWLYVEPVAGMRLLDKSSGQFRVFINGWQKAANVEEPTGGLYVDSEARAAIGALLSALRASGFFPPA